MSEAPTAPEFLSRKYQLQRLLGRGGMGTVYQCREDGTARRFAVKLLNPELLHSESGRTHFHHECELLRRLSHPHILQYIDSGVDEEQDIPYLITELCLNEGGDPFTLADLAARNEKGRLSPRQIETLFPQVFSGMAYLHSQGLIHRDIKPANVLLDLYPEGWVAKVADFGLISLTGEEAFAKRAMLSLSLSVQGAKSGREGALIGTIDYMSPEQREGKELTRASDVYSLGLMLYRLATGRSRVTFQLPSQVVPELPEWVDEVARMSLAAAPEERARDAGALLVAAGGDPDAGGAGELVADTAVEVPGPAVPAPVRAVEAPTEGPVERPPSVAVPELDGPVPVPVQPPPLNLAGAKVRTRPRRFGKRVVMSAVAAAVLVPVLGAAI